MKKIWNGIIKENAVFVLLLGLCPALAVTTTVEKSFVDIAFIKMEMGSDGATEYKIWNPY